MALPDVTAQIAAELRQAWTRLDGPPSALPAINRGEVAIYTAFRRQGADSALLSIIGSYGGTLNDADVLENLRRWNTQRR